MFSIFQKRPREFAAETVSPNSLLPRRMDLEERKAFRRELLDQVIREGLLALDVSPSTYRFRIMPLDVRHHRFIAMIDVSNSFHPRRTGSAWTFADIETLLRKNALERFGLLLDGIYWRAGMLAEEAPGAGISADTRASLADLHPHYQLVSEEEKAALMEAIRQGSDLPVLHVGEWEYQTDMAPLDEHGRGTLPRKAGSRTR